MMNRRNFLQRSALWMGSLALSPWNTRKQMKVEFPEAENLGRVAQGLVNIRAKPNQNSEPTKVIYDDAVVVWLREVVGEAPGGYGPSRWVETPDGFIYSPRLQPVKNILNQPLKELPPSPNPASSTGKGVWAEVTVPYVDVALKHAPNSLLFKEKLETGFPPRLYYKMIVWVDDIETSASGKVLYRVNERYGNPGDAFTVPAETLRPLTGEDVAPITPEVENKRVVVNLTRQTLTCYENEREVYFCQVSTGAKFDAQGNAVEAWATPKGQFTVYRKLVSLHMSGPTTGNWPGVGWTQIFATGGVALHSTYWHNAYGIPRSHGCVNIKPDDAQWVWRWTGPHVGLEPGDIDISSTWPPSGTRVEVIE